jgi:MFS family permease
MAAMVADYRRYLGVLKRVPAAVLVLAFIVLTEFALGAMALAVTYLVKEQGMALKTASLTIGLVFLSAGIIGNVLGGALGDWAEARRPGGRLWFLGLTNLAALPFGLAFLLLPAGQTSILLIGACVFMLSLVSMMRYGPMFAAVQDFAPPTLRATAIATTLVVMGVLGNSLGPLIAGMIGDAASLRLGLLICLLVGGCASIPALWAAQRFSADQARARATWSTATPPS